MKVREILDQISKTGLDIIALKGWEVRKLYPEVKMRQMSDLDFLIHPYRYEIVEKIMAQLGFQGEGSTTWKHDNFMWQEVRVEMHKRLTDDSGAMQKWEKELWSRVIPTEKEHIYKMSPEDFQIFHYVHLHKDFMNGSLGLRRIVDTWLLLKQDYDREFVKAELDKMGLSQFYERMNKLSCVAMGEADMDENSGILLQHAFHYGIYGTEISYKAGRIASMGGSIRKGKIKSAWAAVFLPYSRMKAQFPVLEKCPLLLPICWGKRVRILLRKGIKKNRDKLNYHNVNENDFQEMKRFFQAGGIKVKQ